MASRPQAQHPATACAHLCIQQVFALLPTLRSVCLTVFLPWSILTPHGLCPHWILPPLICPSYPLLILQILAHLLGAHESRPWPPGWVSSWTLCSFPSTKMAVTPGFSVRWLSCLLSAFLHMSLSGQQACLLCTPECISVSWEPATSPAHHTLSKVSERKQGQGQSSQRLTPGTFPEPISWNPGIIWTGRCWLPPSLTRKWRPTECGCFANTAGEIEGVSEWSRKRNLGGPWGLLLTNRRTALSPLFCHAAWH